MWKRVLIYLLVLGLLVTGSLHEDLIAKESSSWVRPSLCALALTFIGWSYLVGPYKAKDSEIDTTRVARSVGFYEIERLKNPDFDFEWRKEISRHMMGPILLWGSAGRRMHSVLTPTGQIKSTLQNELKYLMGYTLLYLGVRSLIKTYFQIRANDFHNLTSPMMNSTPKSILILVSLPKEDKLLGYANYLYSEWAERAQSIVRIDFENLDDLIKRLAEIPKDKLFDRMEVFAHGSPNTIYASKGTRIRTKDLDRLAAANLRIICEMSDVRFYSCSLAGGRPFDSTSSTKFISKFGEALLPGGGRVLAATKNILVYRAYVPLEGWSPAQIKRAEKSWWNFIYLGQMHLVGLGVVFEFVYGILFNVMRNYKSLGSGVVIVDIPKKSE